MKYDIENISKRIERNKKIKKVLRIILYILLIPVVLFSLFLILVELGNSYELPSFLNIDIYRVSSESMEPKLKINDIIVVKKGYSNEEYKVGNIIVFERNDGEIITHRIAGVITSDSRRAYKTKGDNNVTPDEETVKYENIIGKVIYVMPNVGALMQLLKNKLFLAICILILVLIMYLNIRNKKRKLNRKLIRERYEKKSNFYF